MGKATIIGHLGDAQYSVTTKYRNDVGNAAKSLWCADLTEDPALAGDVGTIEVPGEPALQLIRPGYEGRAVWSATRDGMLCKPTELTPEEFFYNLAMLPGWQKFMPRYRIGVVGAVTEADYTANVLPVTIIAPNTSTQQSIDVTPNVPIGKITVEYMECNAYAFEAGDEVVVEYSPVYSGATPISRTITYTPKVIGFRDNPKTCGFIEPWYGPLQTSKNAWKARLLYGPTPFEDLIEDPWTTNPIISAGSRFLFTVGNPVTATRGSVYLYRIRPSGFNANALLLTATLPAPYPISVGELQIEVSDYTPGINLNTGLVAHSWDVVLLTVTNPTGLGAFYYTITAVGSFTIDISAIIGQELTQVVIACPPIGSNGAALTETDVTIKYIKVI